MSKAKSLSKGIAKGQGRLTVEGKRDHCMFKQTLTKRRVITVLLTLVLLATVGFALLPVRYSLTVDVAKLSKDEVLQVFYDTGSNFNEGDSKSIIIRRAAMNVQDSATRLITIPLPAKMIKGLRMDPGVDAGAWEIRSIVLECRLVGYVLRSHTWLPEDIVREFTPLHAIDSFSVRNERVLLDASGVDPYFVYKNDFRKVHEPLWKVARDLKVMLWIITAILGVVLVILNRRTSIEIFIKAIHLTKDLSIPFSESRWIFPAWLWQFLILLALIKFWLVSAQTVPAYPSPHDDELFLRLGQHILSGGWLGEYNNVTLAKGPFYPFWIAVMFLLGVPLSYSHQLLYIGSCLTFIIAIRPLLRNIPSLLLIIYTTLLFHPISYAIGIMPRVIRQGVYISLTLLVLSFAVGLLVRKDASFKTIIKWNIGLGLSLAGFLLTREEGVWLFPALCILFCALFFSVVLFSSNRFKRMMLCCIGLGITFFIIMVVASINRVYYGVFTISELKQSDFVSAYGSLLRVRPQRFQPYLPVSRETRERIYAVSPAFAELQPFLEGDIGKGWAQWGPYAGKEVSTHFLWAFRDAVASAGYYRSGDSAAKYYERLASEVNKACDKGALECYKTRHNSLAPIWRNEYLMPLFSTSAKMVLSNMRLEYIDVQHCSPSSGPDEVVLLFKDMTRDRIAPKADSSLLLIRQQRLDGLKLRVLNSILLFFRFYIVALVTLGIISYVWHMVCGVVKRRINVSLIIMTALFCAVLGRIFLLSLLAVTTWPNISQLPLYEASLSPLFVGFSLFAVLVVYKKDNQKHSNDFQSEVGIGL